MGLSLPLIAALAGTVDSMSLRGELLALGVQTIRCDGQDISHMLARMRGGVAEALPPRANHRDVYGAIGFSKSWSVDLFPDESPDQLVDLTAPLPQTLHHRFDAFLDAGTLEHVFDLRAAFTGLLHSLAADGVAMHISPLDGFANHGFYQFGPKLLARLYAANGFHQMRAWIIDLETDTNRGCIAPVTAFDAPIERNCAMPYRLLFFAARKRTVASGSESGRCVQNAIEPCVSPIDTHLTSHAISPELIAPVDHVMIERLARAGFGLPSQRGNSTMRPLHARWSSLWRR
jgi:hypothetical protein